MVKFICIYIFVSKKWWFFRCFMILIFKKKFLFLRIKLFIHNTKYKFYKYIFGLIFLILEK